MLQMGGDFAFEDANAWFKNLDTLIAAVNREGRVNVSFWYCCYVPGIRLLVLYVTTTATAVLLRALLILLR